jgi:hypothetical protein
VSLNELTTAAQKAAVFSGDVGVGGGGVAGAGAGSRFGHMSSSSHSSSTNNSGNFFPRHIMDNRGMVQSQDTRADDAGGGNPSGVVKFKVSLLALADATFLERSEAAYGLFTLQKRSILEYKLSESAVYVTLTTKGHNRGDFMDVFHPITTTSTTTPSAGRGGPTELTESQCSQMNYCAWLWFLARQVCAKINNIEELGSQRNEDVWKMGSMMIEHGSRSSGVGIDIASNSGKGADVIPGHRQERRAADYS